MSTQDKPVITIGGENLIDTIFSVLPSGETERIDNLGGSPFNVAIAIARQENTPYFVTPISKDDFGDQLFTHLKENGVIPSGQRRQEPTTQAIVTIENDLPSYEFHRDQTAERFVTFQSIQAAMPENPSHFHAGSLAFIGGTDAEAWEEAFHHYSTAGLTTSLDPNVRPTLIDDPVTYRARIERLMACATIIKLSDEDLLWLYPDLSQERAMGRLLENTNASFVALTKGPDGAECWTQKHHCKFDNPPVGNLVDTIGAGDTFMGTLLATLSHQNNLSVDWFETAPKSELSTLMHRALIAACLNCEKEGCDPPTAKTIDNILKRAQHETLSR